MKVEIASKYTFSDKLNADYAFSWSEKHFWYLTALFNTQISCFNNQLLFWIKKLDSQKETWILTSFIFEVDFDRTNRRKGLIKMRFRELA